MRTMGLIFSSLNDRNVPELTSERAIASVPFAGRYRLIDFMLSNMVSASVSTVGIVTKYNFQSLMDHVGSGKHWDLARKNGGIVFLPPYGGDARALYSSRFEAIKSVLMFLKKCSEDIIVMSDCDFAASFDLSKPIEFFTEHGSDITLLYRKKVPDADEQKHRVTLVTDEHANVVGMMPANREYGANNLFTGIIIMRREFLIRIVERAVAAGMKSFSGDVLPNAVRENRVSAFELDGYFASIESLSAYFRQSLNLLAKPARDSLFRTVEVYTKVRDSAPCHMGCGAEVSRSIIADGCFIEGKVENSILFRGVHVAKSAVIKNSIVFQDCEIGDRCNLDYCLLDKMVRVRQNKSLSGCIELPYFVPKQTVL